MPARPAPSRPGFFSGPHPSDRHSGPSRPLRPTIATFRPAPLRLLGGAGETGPGSPLPPDTVALTPTISPPVSLSAPCHTIEGHCILCVVCYHSLREGRTWPAASAAGGSSAHLHASPEGAAETPPAAFLSPLRGCWGGGAPFARRLKHEAKRCRPFVAAFKASVTYSAPRSVSGARCGQPLWAPSSSVLA